ncbi:hypothetical protein SEUCBS139899_009735 [Sporothrix eucalyptigena]|uniref:AB hydrolase-1 domain-containing protein n=1 Tax=Sporothrix eucalyptigena TaxID=1812306 RepID=A0ABP0B3S2_9PEZI
MVTYNKFTLPNGRAISYDLTTGDRTDSLVVVLSNSLCGQFRTWDHVVAVLSGKGYRVLRYDQPGHGASGVPNDLSSTTFAMADDVYALLQHLSLKVVHAWVGVSMGASTAMRAVGSLDELVEGTMQRWFGSDWIASNEDEATRMRGIMLSGTSMDGFETCCTALSSATYDLRLHTVTAGKGCSEVLLLVGEKDANLPTTMQELRAGLERGNGKPVELKVVANAGHVLFVDGFEEFSHLLLAFLQG